MASLEDRKAAEELALEMSQREAIHWLRSQLDCGLKDAYYLTERLANEHPESALAKGSRLKL